MRKIGYIAAGLLFMAGCNGVQEGEKGSPLLDAVPSDALAVAVCESCDAALGALLDSADVLRSFDYGKLSNADAVLALCYDAGLSPLLIMDANSEKSDTSATISSIRKQAGDLGLKNSLAHCNGRRVLVITPSQNVLSLSQRHMDIGASIMDAPGFGNALAATDKNSAIFRNEAARRLVSGGILKTFGLDEMRGLLSRKALETFLRDAGDWTVEDPDKGTLTFVSGSAVEESRISSVLSEARESSIPLPRKEQTGQGKSSTSSLPLDADYVLDVVLKDNFRKSFEDWADACSHIDLYKDSLKRQESRAGKDPLVWEKEMKVKEVARICNGTYKVTVLATGSAKEDRPAAENTYKGFIKALYGLPCDDSHVAQKGNLMIFGSKEDIEAYLDATKETLKGRISFRLISSGTVISSDTKTTRICKI